MQTEILIYSIIFFFDERKTHLTCIQIIELIVFMIGVKIKGGLMIYSRVENESKRRKGILLVVLARTTILNISIEHALGYRKRFAE